MYHSKVIVEQQQEVSEKRGEKKPQLEKLVLDGNKKSFTVITGVGGECRVADVIR